jgi:hypothetical protein
MGLLTVTRNTKIYVVAPPRVSTGGPELLHQLAHHLRVELGIETYMYYYPEIRGDPAHPNYRCYGNPVSKNISDEPQNILIVPEIASAIRLFSRFSKIQKVIWWLSINNFVASVMPYAHMSLLQRTLFGMAKPVHRWVIKRLISSIPSHVFLSKKIGIGLFGDRELVWEQTVKDKKLVLQLMQTLPINQAKLHLCQSYYALDYLTSLGFSNIAYLSDYLSDEFLQHSVAPEEKQDVVAFNPTKGWSFTWRILSTANHLRFEPIYGLSRKRVIDVLTRAKVYIDFGPHPGKDRLPREAVMLGCCVLVGKRGSAANRFDVPIPEIYKFDVEKNSIPEIVLMIERCIKEYAWRVQDFNAYREHTRAEPEIFRNCAREIFG